MRVSVLIPVYNESHSVLEDTVLLVAKTLEKAAESFEIIVIDDGSKEHVQLKNVHAPIQVIRHPVNQGYGSSLKTGLRAARFEQIVITDADATYPIDRIPELLLTQARGFDMVVGARQGDFFKGGLAKRCGRFWLTSLAEYVAGQHIPDINSGLRIFNREKALQFMSVYPSGFSFTTTITLAFMLNNYFVHYLPVPYYKRDGSSHVRYLRDTLRTSQILVEAILVHNPAKLFILLAAICAMSAVMGALLVSLLPVPGIEIFVLGMFVAQIIFALGLLPTYWRRIRN